MTISFIKEQCLVKIIIIYLLEVFYLEQKIYIYYKCLLSILRVAFT